MFLNPTIFDGLIVGKMASIFVASLHGSTQATLNKNMPIHNYRHRRKQNTASLGFRSALSRFMAEEHHVNKPGRTACRPTSCTAYTHWNCFSWTKTGSVETYQYEDPGGDRSKAERQQALAAAVVATHTASLSNDLQYVGRQQNLLSSRANATLVLPATFEKATKLLFCWLSRAWLLGAANTRSRAM